ncbi:MAG: AMP-binding protein [Balneolaceae bacterium]
MVLERETDTVLPPEPNQLFLASETRIYDYGNLYAFCSWFSDKLNTYPVSESRPIAILLDSSDELVFTIAACWYLQIPFMPLSAELTDAEMKATHKKMNFSLTVTDRRNRERVKNSPHRTIPFESLQNESETHSTIRPEGDPEAIFGYFQTSGTTGKAKTVPLKRRQMHAAAASSAENVKPANDRFWLHCLPFHHIGGTSIVLRSLLYQSAIYRMDRFDPEQIAGFLSENPLIQAASLVPTMLKRLLEQPKLHVHNDFKAILLGGGPVSPLLLQECEKRGIPAISSYGLTETCAQIAANPIIHRTGVYHPKNSVGMVFRPNQVEIRSEEGEPLPANESGMIWLKGPQVFDGYYDEEQNNGQFDDEGWFRTGDFGHINRKNQLFIEMRREDRIVTGGENVNPLEVEKALEALAGVTDAAVIGIDDEEWGQRVVAYIVTESDSAEAAPFRDKLKPGLSPYKIPKEFIRTSSLPRTATGKKDRTTLKKNYTETS